MILLIFYHKSSIYYITYDGQTTVISSKLKSQLYIGSIRFIKG